MSERKPHQRAMSAYFFILLGFLLTSLFLALVGRQGAIEGLGILCIGMAAVCWFYGDRRRGT